MKTRRSVSCFVMLVCMLIAAAQVNAVVWDVNDDLAAAGYWPTEGSPVVGPWSIGWADTSTPWEVSLFAEYKGVTWGNNVWVTDAEKTLFTYHPQYDCPPHGGAMGSQCMLVPSSVIRNNDPNVFSQYTVLAWTSPVASPAATFWGQFEEPLADVTDHYIIKLEPETLDPNYFTDNPGEDPNDYVQILYTRINDTLPEQAEPFFITSSIEVGTRILFAVNRNPHATALFNGLSLVDITVTDDYNCEVQNEFRDADINHDCYVNLADLALLAGDWLQCNDPEGPGCTPEDVNAVVRVDFNGYYEYNLPHSNAAWTYEGPGLLGTGTYWNGAEVYWKTPNTILSVYHPGSGTSDDRFLLNDGVTDSHVTVTLAGNQYGDNLAGGEPNPVGNDLLTDYLLSYMEDPNIVITIGGLIPGNAYRLAGYGSHGGAGLGGVWTANGVGPMDLSQSVADTGILENVIADAQGNIIVEIDKDSQYTAATVTVVNGLELEGVFNATFTCQAQGIYKDADIDQNCYVNLEDFAEIANVWLQCNDPKDGNCMPIE